MSITTIWFLFDGFDCLEDEQKPLWASAHPSPKIHENYHAWKYNPNPDGFNYIPGQVRKKL